MTNIPEKVANTVGHAPSGEPTPAKRRRVAARACHVAPSKGKSGKQAAPVKKANARPQGGNGEKRLLEPARGEKPLSSWTC